jgi:hypothetical protein
VLRQSNECEENADSSSPVLSIDFQRQGDKAPNHEAPVMAKGLWCTFNRESPSLGKESLQNELCFKPRQRGTDAQMNPPTKTNVMPRIRPPKIDVFRLSAQRSIPIGSWPKKHNAGTDRNFNAAQGRIDKHATVMTAKWRIQSTDLFDKRRY